MSTIEIPNIEPNSQKYKDEKAAREANRPKVMELSGTITRKKRSLFDRFKDTFVKENPKDVRKYILQEILFPAIVDNARDILIGMFDMTFRGETSARKQKTGVNSLGTRINYGGFFGERREKMPNYRRSDIAHNFDNIFFENRGDAEQALDLMVEILNGDYKQVTVADFYDIVGITGEHTDNKYGWKDLSSAQVRGNSRSGYYIDLPKCIALD